MENELKERLDATDKKLLAVEKQLADREHQIKALLLKTPVGQSSALWVKLQLLQGHAAASTDPNDYDLVIEKSPVSDERWKLDVNDRYQKAVGAVITLATLALGGPFIFLKNLTGQSLLSVFTGSAVWGESLLGGAIVCAVVYSFFSAKWVKLALVNDADFFWIPLSKGLVEFILDLTYLLMMVGFLAGVFFVVEFMTTYIPK